MLLERAATVGKQPRTLQECVDDGRLVDVQFEVARSAADVQRDVVTHDLRAQHGKSFGLRRIDLARHDGAARLVLRNTELTEPGARAGSEEPDVVCELERGRCQRLEGAVGEYERLMAGERGKLVSRRHERDAGFAR